PLILLITIILFFETRKIYDKPIDAVSIVIFLLFFVWLFFGVIIFYYKDTLHNDPLDKVRYYLPSILFYYVIMSWSSFFIEIGLVNKLLNIITVALVINCVYLVFNGIFGFSFTDEIQDRSSGLFESINQAGVVSAFAQIFLLHKLLTPTKKDKTF